MTGANALSAVEGLLPAVVADRLTSKKPAAESLSTIGGDSTDDTSKVVPGESRKLVDMWVKSDSLLEVIDEFDEADRSELMSG